MIKYFFVSVMFVLLAGCVHAPSTVILQPEDRIYTLPKGQPISLVLDNKKIDMVFPYDMKIVSPSVLVATEKKLNDRVLEANGAKKKNNILFTILGGLVSILGAAGVVIAKKKVLEK